MSFTIQASAQKAGDSVFYKPAFRRDVEMHLLMLRNNEITTSRLIEPILIHRFEGDFYGLLRSLGVPTEHHWIYLRVNGMENPNQFGRQLHDPYRGEFSFNLLEPSTDIIEQLRKGFLSTQQ